VSDEVLVKLEVRVARLERLLDAAIGVIARTNGFDPERIRKLLEVDVDESSDSEEGPGASPPPGAGGETIAAAAPPSLSILPGGRRS
jgi:hypothetical protein